MTIEKCVWWKDAVVYQIWVPSYKDSNGDGVGDLPGVISTLDYLKDLGIDMIWLSPMYDSPQVDMGYDISDYQKIYPKYGTLNDMQELIDKCHDKGIKIILDLVANHTSSENKWFQESRSSKNNPKRDWYFWRKPRYDESGNRIEPNNWMSYFSGSAWEYDETTDEYYLRLYAKDQPDLNWNNYEVRNTIYDSVINWWFEKGVDGFRIDTAGKFSKVESFQDAPIILKDSFYQPVGNLALNGPRIHEFHKEMFDRCWSKYDAFVVGEVGRCSKQEALKYVGKSRNEMNAILLFDVVKLIYEKNDRFQKTKWDLIDFKKAIDKQCNLIKGTDAWSTIFLENHDEPRCVSKFINTNYRVEGGKLLTMLQSTLSGTLFIYQGQEIGMTNLPRSWDISEYKDIVTINYYNEFKEKYGKDADFKEKEEKLIDVIKFCSRDHARSPVQWNSEKFAGFSTVEPWTRVNDNYSEINVESQLNDPNSILSFYKQLIKLRKQFKDLFTYGEFEVLDYDNTILFTYVKKSPKFEVPKVYVVLNFSSKWVKFEKLIEGNFNLLVTNVSKKDILDEKLSPYEGRVYIIE
ncbi:unnamed protein product [Candida verbasci]|uniref:Glycosyl hydrolase family 13 catalytic domain-containing protein n=1 Tax=Candida verbasci TaxID=1227364 RepID=A0A9W4U2Z7_9ASCO|nr:unnamed protein product [Candida verbasci]